MFLTGDARFGGLASEATTVSSLPKCPFPRPLLQLVYALTAQKLETFFIGENARTEASTHHVAWPSLLKAVAALSRVGVPRLARWVTTKQRCGCGDAAFGSIARERTHTTSVFLSNDVFWGSVVRNCVQIARQTSLWSCCTHLITITRLTAACLLATVLTWWRIAHQGGEVRLQSLSYATHTHPWSKITQSTLKISWALG